LTAKLSDVSPATPFGDIPGAAGRGTLFVGAPLAATMAVQPDVAGAGERTVQTTLTLVRDTVPNPTATVHGAVQTEGGGARGVAVNGTTAYVCGLTGGTVVDVADEANPTAVGTFGPWDPNPAITFSAVSCSILNGRLIVGFDKGFNAGESATPIR